MPEELRYSPGISIPELNEEVDALWPRLWNDPTMREDAEAAGIDLASLKQVSRTDAITFRRDGAGIDPVSAAILVSFAPVAAKVVRDIWENILLPRIRQDKGQDVLILILEDSDDEKPPR